MAGHDVGMTGESGRGLWLTFARWVALAMFPLSLMSAGATVSMALVAAGGVAAIVGGRHLPPTLRQVHWFMTACYVVLLATDILNGGGWRNFTSTGVNYLHLIAVAPLAHALRLLDIREERLDRAMQLAVWLGVLNSVVRYFVFGIERPGGPELNPIPYGFVIALWGTFLLARSIAAPRRAWFGLFTALLAVVPVVLTESKIVLAAMVAGYSLVVVGTAWSQRSMAVLARSAAVALPILLVSYFALAHRRIEQMVTEIQQYVADGTLTEDSFGYRWELLRVSMRAIADKPWFGHGVTERKLAAFAYVDRDGPNITGLAHLHNDYVTHAVALGIPGLAFVLAFLAFIAVKSRAAADLHRRVSGYALALMLAIYMVSDVVFNMDPMSGAATIAMALVFMQPRPDERPAGG